MRSVTRRISCFCETSFEAAFPETADCGADPEVEQDILSGDFMAVACPACGKRLTPEFPFRLTGVPGLGTIVMVPDVQYSLPLPPQSQPTASIVMLKGASSALLAVA